MADDLVRACGGLMCRPIWRRPLVEVSHRWVALARRPIPRRYFSHARLTAISQLINQNYMINLAGYARKGPRRTHQIFSPRPKQYDDHQSGLGLQPEDQFFLTDKFDLPATSAAFLRLNTDQFILFSFIFSAALRVCLVTHWTHGVVATLNQRQ